MRKLYLYGKGPTNYFIQIQVVVGFSSEHEGRARVTQQRLVIKMILDKCGIYFWHKLLNFNLIRYELTLIQTTLLNTF